MGKGDNEVLQFYRSIISEKTDRIKSYYYVASKSGTPHKVFIKDHLENVSNIEVLTPEISELAVAEETNKFTMIYGPSEIQPNQEIVFGIAFLIKEAYMPEKLDIIVDDKTIIIDSTSKTKDEEELPEEIMPEERVLMFNF